jgi:hypothetical protein
LCANLIHSGLFFLVTKGGRDERWLVYLWREPLPFARKGNMSPEKKQPCISWLFMML